MLSRTLLLMPRVNCWVRDCAYSIVSPHQAESWFLLASCSADLTIKVWDYESKTRIKTITGGHEHNITGVEFMPTGDFLVSASRDGTLRMWDVASG